MLATVTRCNTGPARGEFSDDVPEWVETVHAPAIEAVCSAG
jgi:hypothetical protein